MNHNELREKEIDEARELFEDSCKEMVWGFSTCFVGWNAFDHDEVAYVNVYVNFGWQCFIKGYMTNRHPERKVPYPTHEDNFELQA